MARSLRDYQGALIYAFKQSEIAQEGISSTGWATFLQAVIEDGLCSRWNMAGSHGNENSA